MYYFSYCPACGKKLEGKRYKKKVLPVVEVYKFDDNTLLPPHIRKCIYWMNGESRFMITEGPHKLLVSGDYIIKSGEDYDVVDEETFLKEYEEV